MRKAKALGNAKKNGDTKLIEKAQIEHDSYRDARLQADEMSLGMSYGRLSETIREI